MRVQEFLSGVTSVEDDEKSQDSWILPELCVMDLVSQEILSCILNFPWPLAFSHTLCMIPEFIINNFSQQQFIDRNWGMT
jgi:hypothetical protein